MSELTGDEIRRACEAVPGWTWKKGNPDLAGSIAERDRAYDAEGFLRFVDPRLADADALALLEARLAATGRAYAIRRDGEGYTVTDCGDDPPWCPSVTEPDFSAAAVRAVLAWAEAKETKE